MRFNLNYDNDKAISFLQYALDGLLSEGCRSPIAPER